jgi:hypothetical protein
MDACFESLHWISLILNGRGRASEIKNTIDFDVKGKGDVMAEDLKISVS